MDVSFVDLSTVSAAIDNNDPEKTPANSSRPEVKISGLQEELVLTPDFVRGIEAHNRLERFLIEADWKRALYCWLGDSTAGLSVDKSVLLRRLDRDINDLDELIEQQVDSILHHPRFQQLEASWRSLDFLTQRAWLTENVRIRVLNVSWKEVAKDIDRAIEFDQSQLFKKVYSEQFDTPGGEPFGLLIGDYQISHQSRPGHPINDIVVLRGLSQVAAAAFAPFIAGVHPALIGLESFHELSAPIDFGFIFRQPEYIQWNSFRATEDSRFVGLTLPRILLRAPYEDDGARNEGFRFAEDVHDLNDSRYLWGNACYAFAATVIQAFENSGWLADIRGVQKDESDGRVIAGGGLVQGLPVHYFGTDRPGLLAKYSTEISVTESQEMELTEKGFIPLCNCKDTQWCAFYTNSSVHAPKQNYDAVAANTNARLSATLQYILSASRFAHYLKIIGREKTGSFIQVKELQQKLQEWLHGYTTARDNASSSVKARYPLRESRVEITENPGSPGSYLCAVYLRPHYQLEQLSTFIKLETEISSSQ